MTPNTLFAPDTSRTYSTAAAGNYEARELPCTPGTVLWNPAHSKAYRFVKMTVGAAVAGDALAFSVAGELTRDIVIAGVTDLPAAGMAIVAIAQDAYGWIQCYGLNEVAMVSDGNVTIDDTLSLTTANDLKPATEAEMVGGAIFGVSLLTDTGTALAIGGVLIQCPTDSVNGVA
jgi:hypothetical protein